MNQEASKAVDALGGVTKVSKLFDIAPSSVCAWRKQGIPASRTMYLKAVYGQELELAGVNIEAATCPPSRNNLRYWNNAKASDAPRV